MREKRQKRERSTRERELERERGKEVGTNPIFLHKLFTVPKVCFQTKSNIPNTPFQRAFTHLVDRRQRERSNFGEEKLLIRPQYSAPLCYALHQLANDNLLPLPYGLAPVVQHVNVLLDKIQSLQTISEALVLSSFDFFFCTSVLYCLFSTLQFQGILFMQNYCTATLHFDNL